MTGVMAIRNIRTLGDEILRKKSRPVEVIDDKILTLLDDMREMVETNNAYGIAAPQVGILKRLVVLRSSDDEYIELINPVITEQSGEAVDREGCLSVPDRVGYVKRPNKVKVTALNRHGETCEYTARGYLARVFCHEIDHLDGILYIDKEMKAPAGF